MMHKPTFVKFEGEIHKLKELAKRFERNHVSVSKKYRRCGSPAEIDASFFEIVCPPKPYKGLTIDGKPMSVVDASRIYGVSDTTIHNRIRQYGLELLSAMLMKNWDRPERSFRESSTPTAEERSKLNRIPSPSQFELELLPNTGRFGGVLGQRGSGINVNCTLPSTSVMP